MRLMLKGFLSAQGFEVPEIGILDIGARINPKEQKEYQCLLDQEQGRVVGFEPNEEACDQLNQTYASDSVRMLPYFIGDGSERTFYETASGMCASLYEPNMDLLELFLDIAEAMKVVQTHQVQTSRLDDIADIDFPVDYIKIDIQGAELLALKGAEEMLKNVTVIQTEAEWVPLYKNQPLFSELELYLRSQGFVVHKNIGFGTRSFAPFAMSQGGKSAGPQHLWSDIVFVKDFTSLQSLETRQLLAWATVLNDVYKSGDLVGLLLRHAGDRVGIDQLHVRYVAWVKSVLSANQAAGAG